MLLKSHPRLRRALLITGATLVLLVCTSLFFPHQVLTCDSGHVTADAIVLLGGGWIERSERAAELFHEHAAPKILITGAGDCDSNRRLLVKAGVPESAIEIEPRAISTKQNAQFSIPLLRAGNANKVILVTTWYHSRRALACFRHYAPEIQFYSRPSYYAYPRPQWHEKRISRFIHAEYLKLIGYWGCYGVCPL